MGIALLQLKVEDLVELRTLSVRGEVKVLSGYLKNSLEKLRVESDEITGNVADLINKGSRQTLVQVLNLLDTDSLTEEYTRLERNSVINSAPSIH